jgi:hypothetical protein
LEIDDDENVFSKNERRCVEFRKREKETLKFLNDASTFFIDALTKKNEKLCEQF